MTAKAERPQPSSRSSCAAKPANSTRGPAKPQYWPRRTREGGGAGAGGRGPGGTPPLHQRLGDRDFRDVLSKGLAACRRNLVTVAIFSFFVNTLVLAIPIYLFNISDRVLTSRSSDTLAMLSLVVVGAILAHVLMDMMRRFILMRIAVEAESKLGAPVLSAAAKASQNGSSREFQTLSDLQHIRGFLTGPVLLMMLDAPVAPVYLLAVFLIHPDLGYIVSVTGIMLLADRDAEPEADGRSLCPGECLRESSQSSGRRDGHEIRRSSTPWE